MQLPRYFRRSRDMTPIVKPRPDIHFRVQTPFVLEVVFSYLLIFDCFILQHFNMPTTVSRTERREWAGI